MIYKYLLSNCSQIQPYIVNYSFDLKSDNMKIGTFSAFLFRVNTYQIFMLVQLCSVFGTKDQTQHLVLAGQALTSWS